MIKRMLLRALLFGLTLSLPAQNAFVDYFTAPAETRHNEPLRVWEVGSLGDFGLANSLISMLDIFQRELVIDMNQIDQSVPQAGWGLTGDMALKSFINVNPKGIRWGIGSFTNMDSRFDLNVPKSFISLLSQGKGKEDVQGSFSVSGALFVETGINGHMTFLDKKLRVELAPAWFIPILYIPKSTINYTIKTDETILIDASASMAVYLPYNEKSLTDYGGGDLSVSAEYALFPILDLGASLSHIPIVPARLSNKAGLNMSGDTPIFEDDNVFDGINSIKDPKIDMDNMVKDERWVMRPLRFDIYALFRPLRRDLVTVKPNFGFTALNPSEEFYVNWGLEGQLNLSRILFVTLNTGLLEGLWRHNLGLSLNLHAIQFDFSMGMRSQDFVHSFMLNGLSATMGLTIGW